MTKPRIWNRIARTVVRNICEGIVKSYWIPNNERLNLQARQQHPLSTITPMMCHRGGHRSRRSVLSATAPLTNAPPRVKILTTARSRVNVSKTARSRVIAQIPTARSRVIARIPTARSPLLPRHQDHRLCHGRVLQKNR